MESPVYRQTPQQALEAVDSREEGLTSREAQERLEKFGPNVLREEKKKPVWQVFLEQFKDLLVVILIAAAVISMLSGNVESTIVIFAVLILNAVLRLWKKSVLDKRTLALFLVIFLLSVFGGLLPVSISPAVYVVAAALAGLLLAPGAKKAEEK